TKSARMVHVGAVDAPVTLADVKAIASEVWKAVGKGKDAPETAGVDILGWEFAFELNELGKQVAAEAHVDVAFKKIPREVLEKKAVEQGDIKFFELAALSVKIKQKGRDLALKLDDFLFRRMTFPMKLGRQSSIGANGLISGRWIGATRTILSTISGKAIEPEGVSLSSAELPP